MGWSGNVPEKYKVSYGDYNTINPKFLSGKINKKIQNIWNVKKEISIHYLKNETKK